MKKLLLTTSICFITNLFCVYLAFSNGFLMINDENAGPLSIIKQNIEIVIDNQVAQTHINQVFRNHTKKDIEGEYLFPLNENASISEFAMWDGKKKILGDIMEKEEARNIYNEIVRQKKDPALLEYIGKNKFSSRVYPIPANSDKRIELKYSEVLKYDSGVISYQYPLNSIAFNKKPIKEFSFSIILTDQKTINRVYSTSHKISINKIDKHNVRISFEDSNISPDKDFNLFYEISSDKIGINFLTYKTIKDDGYFMLLISPQEIVDNSDIVGREVGFVFDTSGSMSGEKIEQAKNALRLCVDSLNPNDTFNIITFNDGIKTFSNRFITADERNIRDAQKFINSLAAGGGTNINEAVLSGLKMLTDNERGKVIIFLTDGLPTVGTTDTGRIIKNVLQYNKRRNTRIFAFGVGDDVSTELLDKIALKNRGAAEYVKPNEKIDIKVSLFFEKIRKPLLVNLDVDFGSVNTYNVYPKNLPDIFQGTQLILTGKYTGSGGTKITIRGGLNDKKVEFPYSAIFPIKSKDKKFVGRFWAQRRTDYLIDEIKLKGENKELRDEIIQLSKNFKFMTPYTSFLVTEPEYKRDNRIANVAPPTTSPSVLHALSAAPSETAPMVMKERREQAISGNYQAKIIDRYIDFSKTKKEDKNIRLPKPEAATTLSKTVDAEYKNLVKHIETKFKNNSKISRYDFIEILWIFVDYLLQDQNLKPVTIADAKMSFFDVSPRHPAYKSLEKLIKYGFLKWQKEKDGEFFNGDEYITLGKAAETIVDMLERFAVLSSDKKLLKEIKNRLSDAAAFIVSAGIMEKEDAYKVNSLITKEDVLKYFERIKNYL